MNSHPAIMAEILMDERYVEALKALADPNRLRLFWLLAKIDERICVAEVMDVLNDTHYNASRNLKLLKNAGLITAQKEGKWVFYTLTHSDAPFFSRLLDTVRAIPENEFVEETDRCRQRLAMRKDGRCVVGPISKITPQAT